MSAQRWGVAIVGCGIIGRTHVVAVSGFEELPIVALVDTVEQNARALADLVQSAGKPRPRIVATLDDALADAAVDLVAVTTPSGLHIDQGLAALAAGKHVVIEKPLDVSLRRAAEIERAAADAATRGIVASVISQHRFDDATAVVDRAIAEGRLGTITSAIATSPRWRSQDYYDSGAWRGTW